PGSFSSVFLSDGTTGAVVRNSVLTGNDAGAGIASGNGPLGVNGTLIENNDISHWSTGIAAQNGANVVIGGNQIHNNGTGIALATISNVSIQRNALASNNTAILINGGSAFLINSNNIAGNQIGIQDTDSTS